MGVAVEGTEGASLMLGAFEAQGPVAGTDGVPQVLGGLGRAPMGGARWGSEQ